MDDLLLVSFWFSKVTFYYSPHLPGLHALPMHFSSLCNDTHRSSKQKSTSTAHLPHWEIGMQEARMMSMLVCEGAQQTSTSKVSQEIYKLRVTTKFSSACLLEFCD